LNSVRPTLANKYFIEKVHILQNKFHDLIDKYTLQLEIDNKTFNTIGYVRIVFVIIMAVCVFFLFSNWFSIEIFLLSLVVFVINIVFWIYHYKLDDKIKYGKGIVAICNEHISRITGKWRSFQDNGDEFVDESHPYACNLDIVGAKSFFQYLNTTHTWHGRQRFASDLTNPTYDISKLQERQKAIQELSQNIEFTSTIQYYLSHIKTSSIEVQLANELSDSQSFLRHRVIGYIIRYGSIISCALFLSGLIMQHWWLGLAGFLMTIVQSIICLKGRQFNPIKYLGVMNHISYKELNKYVTAMNFIINHEFSTRELNRIKSQLHEALMAVKSLEKISNMLNFKYNPILYFFLKYFLSWDNRVALMLEEWKYKYHCQGGVWLDVIGEFESLVSFSHFPNVCKNTILPDIIESDKNIIKADNLGHPLIPNINRVGNDICMENEIFIISGSNMSGKTTFMRTVGCNLVLARAGSFVCADKMVCTFFDVFTSMRINDSLDQGVSTFYAELKRIKRIIEMAQCEDQRLIFLIDEIFKGTNSADRLMGAEAVIKQLNTLGVVGMISTHDLELCNLASIHSRIKNYSFTELYQNDSACFDYKIKKGSSKATNAKFLMEMLGLGTAQD